MCAGSGLGKAISALTEFAAVASDIAPIIPRYDMYAEREDWVNQKWTEMIAG